MYLLACSNINYDWQGILTWADGTVYKIKEVIGTNQFKLQTASGSDFTYGGTGGSSADAFIRFDGFSGVRGVLYM